MILPSKHLSQDRALLTVGAHILQRLNEPKTVSALWEELSRQRETTRAATPLLSYDGFVLTLDLLFLFRAIQLKDGVLSRQLP